VSREHSPPATLFKQFGRETVQRPGVAARQIGDPMPVAPGEQDVLERIAVRLEAHRGEPAGPAVGPRSRRPDDAATSSPLSLCCSA